MKVYKVVSVIHWSDGSRDYCSASWRTIGEITDEWTLVYKQDEPTYPKTGKLFAFDTAEHAIHFFDKHCGKEVWEAETSYCTKADYIPIFTCAIENFWCGDDVIELIHAPRGTLFCDDITLVHKIYP